MVHQDKEAQQTPAQDQPQWHAPQLHCFDARDAENSETPKLPFDHAGYYHS